MRHKQRPVKSSRHKSVTFIIDGQTSFGDQNNVASASASAAAASNNAPSIDSHKNLIATHNHNNHNHNHDDDHQHNHHLHRYQQNQPTQFNLATPKQQQQRQHQPVTSTQQPRLTSTSTARNNEEQDNNNDSTSTNHILNDPLLRKQFAHNYRHMSDVMRLAFLENNDISIDDCSTIDFNFATDSILHRNIQQQLQQERRDQLQLRQQQHQHQPRHRQQQHQHQHQQYDQGLEDDDEYDDNNYASADDYEVSDSAIFATTAPNSSNLYSTITTTTNNIITDNIINNTSTHQEPINRVVAGSYGKKRTKESTSCHVIPHQSPVNEEIVQNYGDGFLCDEPGCGKSFPSLRKLRHHKVVHSDDFPFVCEFNGCAKKFKRKFGIDLHSTTHFDLDPDMFSKTSNNSSLPFFGRRMQYSMCKPCGQKFKTVHEYQYHMLKHGKEPFKCPVKGCGQTFGIWKSFQKHRASHYFNYYCKMDPQCDHHTSNLQLLKLHIYCCHFRRKLPENATLASKDAAEKEPGLDEPSLDEPSIDESMDVVDEDKSQITGHHLEEGDGDEDEQSMKDSSFAADNSQMSTETTPRRDSRLRKNPPRSSTFGHQDYASLNSGSSFVKSPALQSQSKRTRSAAKQQPQQQQLRERQQLQQQHDQTLGEEYANTNDCEISDSSIFATSTPTPSNINITSTPREPMNRVDGSNGKKRTKESAGHIVIQSPVKEEIVQNYGDGFLCDEPGCGKSFPSLRKLRHHKVVHSDDFPFVCEFNGCAKKFKRKFGIDLHSTTHFDLDPDMFSKTSNNSSLPFFGRRMQYSMCKPCGQKFKTVHEYQYHMLKHGKEPFKCPVKGCGQTFGIWKSFQKHRASHYFNYYCKMDPQCDHHTSNLQLLKLHIYCCHFRRRLPENATLASKDTTEKEPNLDEPSLDEPSLDEPSLDEPSLDEPGSEESMDVVDGEQSQDIVHMDGGEDDDNGGEEDEEDLVEDEDEDDEELRLKDSSFASDNSRRSNESTPRRDLRLRKNPPRSSTFGHQDYASISNGPSTRNKFKCHLCDYKFSVRFQLTKHLSTHLELTPEMYSATADKQVVQLSERRRREFYCDKCTVKFEQMSELDNHMRKHGPRPYVCNFCPLPSTFRLAKQYLSHLYEHRFNYKCTVVPDCDFTINRKDALKLHIFRMHLDQKLPTWIEDYASLV